MSSLASTLLMSALSGKRSERVAVLPGESGGEAHVSAAARIAKPTARKGQTHMLPARSQRCHLALRASSSSRLVSQLRRRRVRCRGGRRALPAQRGAPDTEHVALALDVQALGIDAGAVQQQLELVLRHRSAARVRPRVALSDNATTPAGARERLRCAASRAASARAGCSPAARRRHVAHLRLVEVQAERAHVAADVAAAAAAVAAAAKPSEVGERVEHGRCAPSQR